MCKVKLCSFPASRYTLDFPTNICMSWSRWWNAGGRGLPSYRVPEIHHRPFPHSLSLPPRISARCGGKCEHRGAHEWGGYDSKMCCTWFWQAILRFPDGTAAARVPVDIKVSTSKKSWQGPTNQQGAVSTVFNIPSVSRITVEVSGELDGTAPFPPSNPV